MQRSHWTLGGRGLPYVPFVEDWTPAQPPGEPPAYAPLYRASRRRAAPEVVAAALLPTAVPDLLLVTGGDDRVWPAAEHADVLGRRRADRGLPTTRVHHADAGHRAVLPGEPVVSAGQHMARGGSPAADRLLGAKAWPHLADLVRGHAPPEGGTRAT